MSIEIAKSRIAECAEKRSPYLDLCGLKLSFSPIEISQLTHLTKLNCNSNQLQSLQELKQLTTLLCAWNQLNNLKCIEVLAQLTELNCNSNEVSSLKGIDELTQLTKLHCAWNQLKSIKGIEALIQLTELDCAWNQIESLQGIGELKQITTLHCPWNQLDNLNGIEELAQLTKLYCSQNNIESLQEIGGLTQLTNSPGSVTVGGSINNSPVNINIGATEIDRVAQREDITGLISEIIDAGISDKDKYIGQLSVVHEELGEEEPDDGYIGESLTRFSKILDRLEKGQTLYNRIATFLTGFGFMV